MRKSEISGSRVRNVLLVAGLLVVTMPLLAAQEISRTGVIVDAGTPGTFLLQDFEGGETRVLFDERTQISERKKNPFRKAKRYTAEELFLGLQVEVSGYLKDKNTLLAAEIRFTQDDLKTAEVVSASVVPIERDLQGTRDRLNELEERHKEDSQAVSGQLTELGEAYRASRDRIEENREASHRAQETADLALTNTDLNTRRMNRLDDYEVGRTETIFYQFDKTELSEEARAKLDALAGEIPSQKGYLIEVKGFASADGDTVYNSRLSQKRAESVVQYLVEHHQISLRRFIMPYGFGEQNPIADNAKVEGRRKNRRVEVRVLISRGLLETADMRGK